MMVFGNYYNFVISFQQWYFRYYCFGPASGLFFTAAVSHLRKEAPILAS